MVEMKWIVSLVTSPKYGMQNILLFVDGTVELQALISEIIMHQYALYYHFSNWDVLCNQTTILLFLFYLCFHNGLLTFHLREISHIY